MCQRHGSNQNSHPPVLVRKPLCNQWMHYHISSRGVFGINHFKLRNIDVVAIEWFATADRGCIMARIHRWSVMIYGAFCHIGTWKRAGLTLEISQHNTAIVRCWLGMQFTRFANCAVLTVSVERKQEKWSRLNIRLTRQIRTPVLRIPPAVTSQAKMKNWFHECQKWVSHMIGQYAHI